MKTYLTSFAVLKVAEGNRLVATYSKVDENGEYIAQNQRTSVLVVDDAVESAIDTIETAIAEIIKKKEV